MEVHNDSVSRLEHDHHHLTRMVTEMRESIRVALRDEGPVEDLQDDLQDFLKLATEELYEHFNREEEGLFPYLASELPETAERIAGLEQAHDRMCGVIVRLEHIARGRPEDFVEGFDMVVALFARFDAYFTRHARDEWALLRDARAQLDDEQQKIVAKLLEDL